MNDEINWQETTGKVFKADDPGTQGHLSHFHHLDVECQAPEG